MWDRVSYLLMFLFTVYSAIYLYVEKETRQMHSSKRERIPSCLGQDLNLLTSEL